ncbi:MAG: hypothetical protein WCT14_17965 [Treponemataceae bacterium]
MESHPVFLTTLEPLPDDQTAPPIVRAMLRAGTAASVGPMAAVAGAIAEAVGRTLQERFTLKEIVVENGGDLWISIHEPLIVSIYAGLSSLSEKIGITVSPELSPCGLATSSGTVGPSLSYGKADAAVAIATDAAAADAWATALGNRCRAWAQAEDAVRQLVSPERPELRGVLVVMADKLAASGAIRLTPLQKYRDSL